MFACLWKFPPPPPFLFQVLSPFLFSLYSSWITASLMPPGLHEKDWLFTNHSCQSGHFFLLVGRLSINKLVNFCILSWLHIVVEFSIAVFFFCHQNLCFGLFGIITYWIMLESWSPNNQGFTVPRNIKHNCFLMELIVIFSCY